MAGREGAVGRGGRSNGQEQRRQLGVSEECQAVKLGKRTAQLANTPGAGGGSGVGHQGQYRGSVRGGGWGRRMTLTDKRLKMAWRGGLWERSPRPPRGESKHRRRTKADCGIWRQR